MLLAVGLASLGVAMATDDGQYVSQRSSSSTDSNTTNMAPDGIVTKGTSRRSLISNMPRILLPLLSPSASRRSPLQLAVAAYSGRGKHLSQDLQTGGPLRGTRHTKGLAQALCDRQKAPHNDFCASHPCIAGHGHWEAQGSLYDYHRSIQ